MINVFLQHPIWLYGLQAVRDRAPPLYGVVWRAYITYTATFHTAIYTANVWHHHHQYRSNVYPIRTAEAACATTKHENGSYIVCVVSTDYVHGV